MFALISKKKNTNGQHHSFVIFSPEKCMQNVQVWKFDFSVASQIIFLIYAIPY